MKLALALSLPLIGGCYVRTTAPAAPVQPQVAAAGCEQQAAEDRDDDDHDNDTADIDNDNDGDSHDADAGERHDDDDDHDDDD